MTKCNKSGYNHTLYNQNRVRSKSGKKLENTIEHAILLKKKAAITWDTKWLKMAWLKADAKLKKYGVTETMINAVLERKWLSHLAK